jgi:hypothetical protein
MLLRTATVLGLALLTVGADTRDASAAAAATQPDANDWLIGPIVRGRSYSRGMPLHPTPRRDGAWHIDLPQAPSSLHGVTFPHGSLAGKRRIVMRYRVEMDPGVGIYARTQPGGRSMLTLYFQRSGDNWTGRGPYDGYRWFATFATQSPITAGEHVMVAPLNGPWTAVQSFTARTHPQAFRDAVSEADHVGFVLGGGDGYGHGVYATGRARLIVTDFRIE